MKVIIAGSRTASYASIIEAVRSSGIEGDISEVVCGMAKGADLHGKTYAEGQGLPVKEFPANWAKHGRAAGPIRNRQMAEYADALIAVWHNNSPGTKNMIDEAKARGLQVFVAEGKELHR